MSRDSEPIGMCPACRIPLYLYRGMICGSKEDVEMIRDYASLSVSERAHVHCLKGRTT